MNKYITFLIWLQIKKNHFISQKVKKISISIFKFFALLSYHLKLLICNCETIKNMR